MKFRCTQNSIRLRLRRSDVDRLKSTAQVEEVIHFGHEHKLEVLLMSEIGEPRIRAELINSKIIVYLPEANCNQWINSKEISLRGIQSDGRGGELEILIEKDISCKDRAEETSMIFINHNLPAMLSQQAGITQGND